MVSVDVFAVWTEKMKFLVWPIGFGLFLAACSTQPSGSGAANATINANCPMWSTGAAMGGQSSAERRSCVVVVTQSSPVTAMPTSTISPNVSVPSPSIP